MSYETYKVLHLLGIFFLFTSLGGVALHAINGGSKNDNRGRRAIASMHGLGLLLLLVAGFGMLARKDLMTGGMPGWVWGKLLVWVILGGLLYVPYRRPALARPVLWLVPLFGLLAALLAVYQPG